MMHVVVVVLLTKPFDFLTLPLLIAVVVSQGP